MKRILTGISMLACAGMMMGAAASDASACEGKKRGKKLAQMMTFDANQDGKLDRTELTKAHTARLTERFQKMDANQDGAVDESERQVLRERRANKGERKRGRRGHKMKKLDLNNDGTLTMDEMLQNAELRVSKMLEHLDTDNDQALSPEELKAGQKRMRRHMRVRGV